MTAAAVFVWSGFALFAIGLVLGLIVWVPKWLDGFGWPWDPEAWKRRMRHKFGPMSRREAKLWLVSLALLVAAAGLVATGRAIR
jgi:hypothetical protein